MNHILSDLKSLIALASIKAPARDNQPFGPAIDQTLDAMLEICRREGMVVYRDPKGYYGYAEIGTGELFGILCHLDVVPAGNLSQWRTPPFEMTRQAGMVYGRGVQDDKGPSLIALHALLDLIKQGRRLKRTVRFIFGLDEENDWRCIEQYLADQMAVPAMGFVPDGSFPLTFAEKGLWQVQLVGQHPEEVELQAGQALNVVPGEAVFHQPSLALLEHLRQLDFELEMGNDSVKVFGRNAHAAVAHLGKNALAGLFEAIHQAGYESATARFVSDKLFGAVHGEKLFPIRHDEVSGDMTLNLATADIAPGRQIIGLDIRYPVTVALEYYRDQLRRQAERYGFRLVELSHLKPLYVPQDSPLIQALMQAYQSITQDHQSLPEVSGGATYARSMANFVAFGAHLPGSDDFVHQPNEGMSLRDMELAYQIYRQAYKNLVIEENA